MFNLNVLKKFAPVLLTGAMLFGMTTVANAATKETVDSVTLNVSYELSNGMTKSDVDIDCESDGVDNAVVSSITNTSYGKKPKVTIKLKADSDYTFKGLSKSDVSVSGDDASVTKVSPSSSSCTVTITLPKIGTTDDTSLEVSDVTWGEDDNGVVVWEQADDADKYEVKLMRGSSTKETVTTNNTSYNFRSAIRANGKGTYTVRVRAIAGSYKGDWTESEDWDIDEDILSDLGGKTSGGSSSGSGSSSSSGGAPSGSSSSGGAWLRDTNGWWYCNADRSYTTNNWQQIDGYWYFFNEYGYMKTGWLQSPYSGKWYWLSTDSNTYGRMLTNQWVDNGRYYVDANGIWNGQTR